MSAQRTRINVVSANIANAKKQLILKRVDHIKATSCFEDVLLANKTRRTNSNDIEVNNSPQSDLALRAVGVKRLFIQMHNLY